MNAVPLEEIVKCYRHLEGLNRPQLDAVLHNRGPILVLAGAGSGKTRVLTRRVAHLVLAHHVAPESILAVTFTNKATDEMRSRLSDLLGPQADRLWIATFHSAALRILRRHARLIGYSDRFVVYDDGDSKALMKNLLKQLGIDQQEYKPRYFLSIIDWAKNSLTDAEEFAREAHSYKENLAADVYIAYQQALLKANAMDFGDLLVNAVRLLQQEQGILRLYQETLHYILVDEFQDTNKAQYLLTCMLSAHYRNLLVVGDDDQSIYAFRGATIQNILNFERDFKDAKVIKLEQNYRSSANILDAAHAVIEKNGDRKGKKLWTVSGSGDRIVDYTGQNEAAEARFIAAEIKAIIKDEASLRDIAVFYRTNAQSRALEEEFTRRGIPYRIYGGLKFYERKEIKDILAYLRLVTNEADNQAFTRIINTPPRGIGQQSIAMLENIASEKSISLLSAARIAAARSKPIASFVGILEELQQHANRLALSQLIIKTLELSEYKARLTAAADPAAESRLENLQELAGFAAQMENRGDSPMQVLQYFLDRVSLTAGDDDTPENNSDEAKVFTRPDTVSLMTLHLAKGLEFPFVFLTGTEDGLLPHYHSRSDKQSIEEERRLCYVGMTRAMRRLYLTRAMHRSMFSAADSFGEGGYYRQPSPFLFDIPPQLIERRGGLEMFDELPSLDEEEELVDFLADTPMLKSKVKKRGIELPGVYTAEELPLSQIGQQIAPVEQLQVGVRVVHPSLGCGIIEAVKLVAKGNPWKSKVSVRFMDYEEPKTLVIGHAKLRLAE